MKYPGVLLVILYIVPFLFGRTHAEEWTIDKIFGPQKLRPDTLHLAKWQRDNKSFLFKDNSDGSLYRHDAARGKETILLDRNLLQDPQSGKLLDIDDYKLSKDETKILIKSDSKRVWRRNDLARYFIFDVKTQTLNPVGPPDRRVFHAKLSTDGQMVGYVYNNNIFIQDLSSGFIREITSDGSDDIINGRFDWVYEEEFGMRDGWRWSPDGTKIAFWRLDQSALPVYSWIDWEPRHARVKSVRYPNPGDPVSTVKIGVYDLKNDTITWMDTAIDEDHYLPRMEWLNADSLLIQRINRHQNNLQLLIADSQSGQTQVLINETDTCWVEVDDDFNYLAEAGQFVWTSERDGFNHIYLFSMQGDLVRQLTAGTWVVREIVGVDEANNRVFFTANKDDLRENHIYSVGLDGQNINRINSKPGDHKPLFSPDYQYLLDTWSTVDLLPRTALLTSAGKQIRTIIRNDTSIDIAVPEFLSLVTSDGVTLQAMITKPKDFDPDKKYPVLIYGYGGPGSQLVTNCFGRLRDRLWNTLLTQEGYIIFTVDNRGTGGRGKRFKNLAYGDIGKYALQDHVEAAKFLGGLPWVDAGRIGIWGWSGGGYLTLMAMTRGSDYFKTGIAVAPVTDFRFYDVIWTERYMGLPSENSAGYDAASVLSYTDQYREGLLIVHGSADDNVHVQHTMKFSDELQYNGKPFTMMIYPGRNHSLIGKKKTPYLHLYSMMTTYLLENL